MADGETSRLVRLARIALDIERKRALCAQLEESLNRAEQTGLAVAAQRTTLGKLRALLDHALALLQTVDGERPAIDIDAMEAALADPLWIDAQDLPGALSASANERSQALLDHSLTVLGWELMLPPVDVLTRDARRARVPLPDVLAAADRFAVLIERANDALHAQNLDAIDATLAELEAERPALEKLLADLGQSKVSSEPFARHADLLLVRSDRMRRAYRYTLVLRTPGARGAHGVNIQDSTTLVEEDHLRLRRAVRDITARINDGLARQFDESLTDSSAGAAPATEDVNDLARQTGSLMYDLLLPQDMQRYLRETPCSLTITTNDLELPWELLYDGHGQGEYLCMERPVARMPMGRAYPRPDTWRQSVSRPPRIALVYADPTGDLPDAAREVRHIQRSLHERWGNEVFVDVLLGRDASGERLNRLLVSGDYDVIHYAGHARFDTAQPEDSALLLHRGELLPAEKIGRLLTGRPLVFVNACESGKTANEKKPQSVGRYLQRPAEGLATAFIYGGALAYIGSLWPVYDDAAADFAAAFYSDLLEGYMLGEAMRRARRQSKESYPRQMTWASFVLYGNPTARLLE